MNNAILHLVVLSVASGAVISIIPEGGVKSITAILSTLILISSIIGSIGKPDMHEYALKAADVDNIEQEFKLSTVENAAALKHIYLENQCIEYILDKAKECNIIVHEVDIEITENKDFVPQPFSVSLVGEWDAKNKLTAIDNISRDLGIPSERQHWHYEQH